MTDIKHSYNGKIIWLSYKKVAGTFFYDVLITKNGKLLSSEIIYTRSQADEVINNIKSSL